MVKPRLPFTTNSTCGKQREGSADFLPSLAQISHSCTLFNDPALLQNSVKFLWQTLFTIEKSTSGCSFTTGLTGLGVVGAFL